ncbi:MAG: hypothetical protein NTZ05_00800 [Chloroflexi bacterium]|nr:hypothetical protein [Chloroflexota bacterium]
MTLSEVRGPPLGTVTAEGRFRIVSREETLHAASSPSLDASDAGNTKSGAGTENGAERKVGAWLPAVEVVARG